MNSHKKLILKKKEQEVKVIKIETYKFNSFVNKLIIAQHRICCRLIMHSLMSHLYLLLIKEFLILFIFVYLKLL